MRFVTGGTGMVGSHLICDLVLREIPVRAMKRKSSSLEWFDYVSKIRNVSQKQIDEYLNWVEGDLTDIHSFEEALEGVSIVYHSAALVSFSKHETALLYKNNVDGTANLVNACLEKRVRKICYVSSIAAIGRRKNSEKIDENTSWEESEWNSDYGKSKYLGEMEIWRGQEEGLEVVIVNPGIILGEGNWNSGAGTLFGKIYKGFFFYTMGVTGYIDVLDVTDALILLGENEKHKGTCYILVSENLSYQELFFYIADEFKVSRPKLKINSSMAAIAVFILKLLENIGIRFGVITSKTVKTATGKYYYDGSKITEQTEFKYRTIKDSLKRICKNYIETKK